MKDNLTKSIAWVLGSVLLCLSMGCQPQTTVPANSDVSSTTSDSTAAETAAEDTSPFELEQDFVQLTRADFDEFGAEPQTWTSVAEGIQCTGKPRGYLFTKQPYSNFTLRLQLRFPRPAKLTDDDKFKGNTGFLVYINGEHKLWPNCIEVQGKHIQIAAIKENGGADPVVVEDQEPVRKQARNPVGQWNSFEVVSKDGALIARLNDQIVATSQPGKLTTGLIGIQSEDHPFEVRRIRVRSD